MKHYYAVDWIENKVLNYCFESPRATMPSSSGLRDKDKQKFQYSTNMHSGFFEPYIEANEIKEDRQVAFIVLKWCYNQKFCLTL